MNERSRRMRRTMEKEQLDALILTLPENVLLLSGYWPMIGASVLMFPREGQPTCIIPECYRNDLAGIFAEIHQVFYPYGVLSAPAPLTGIRGYLASIAVASWKRIGYDGSFGTIAPSWNCAEVLSPLGHAEPFLRSLFPDAELVDFSGRIEAERARKTPAEIEKLRVAAEVSALGLQAFDELAKAGASGVELAAAVEEAVMVRGTGFHGARRVRAFAQVAAGPEESALGYRPNEISPTRTLRDSDAALLELGVVADGYWADRTRVRVAGKPTAAQQKIFDAVREAQEAAIAAIRPGALCAEVDAAARGVIRQRGYEEFFPHSTGHGLGFRYHESLGLLAPSSTEILEEGMVVTVEPGIYRQPEGGFRIEDDVLVTATGAEVLGAHPKRLSGS